MSGIETVYGLASDLTEAGGGFVSFRIDQHGRVTYCATRGLEHDAERVLTAQAEAVALSLEQARPVVWVLAESRAAALLWARRGLDPQARLVPFGSTAEVEGRVFRPGDRIVQLKGASPELVEAAARQVGHAGQSWYVATGGARQ